MAESGAEEACILEKGHGRQLGHIVLQLVLVVVHAEVVTHRVLARRPSPKHHAVFGAH